MRYGIGLVTLWLVLITLANFYDAYSCHNLGKYTNRTTFYVALDACYVTTDEGIIMRYDSYYKE